MLSRGKFLSHFFLTMFHFSARIQIKKEVHPMKKIKQVLALIGVVILIGLYVATLYCALSANENFMNMLMTSIYATVVIPVLLWAYSFVYKIIGDHFKKDE